MSGALAALLDQVSQMSIELSPDTLDRLASEISNVKTSGAHVRISARTPRERVLLDRLVELWRDTAAVDQQALALALRTAARTASRVATEEVVDLVWTGPRPSQVPVRRNDQALHEVIESAEREVLLVSFAVFNVPVIAAALTRAVDRAVRVRLVLEFEGPVEGDQTYDPMAALGELPEAVDVLHWPIERRPTIAASGKRGYIHVKCAVADRNLAFVSSANLTAYAMESNMELGVLIRGGPVPVRIAEIFDRLIVDGILVPRARRGGAH